MSLVSDLPGISGGLPACSPECFANSDTAQPVEELRKLNVCSCTSVFCRIVENKKGHQLPGWHWIFFLLHGQEKLTQTMCLQMLLLKLLLTFFQYLGHCFSSCKPCSVPYKLLLGRKGRKRRHLGLSFCRHSSCFPHVFVIGNRKMLVFYSAVNIHWLVLLICASVCPWVWNEDQD